MLASGGQLSLQSPKRPLVAHDFHIWTCQSKAHILPCLAAQLSHSLKVTPLLTAILIPPTLPGFKLIGQLTVTQFVQYELIN